MKKAIDYIDEAISITRSRLETGSRDAVYSGLLYNLEFLTKVVLGVEADKAQLHRLKICVWPAEDFHRDDPEHSDALAIVDHIRDQIARGLKIQLPDGQPPESLSNHR
ncbi:immunity protein Tsi6 family protein [Pseudomonas sp. F3-2]|uniref:immunity protein Tsi6 family protein n=1 Tax=Pseudomonas sp. F3-2 TaxID=3141539 RepID=UPI00315D8F61